MRLLYEHDAEVAHWVSEQIPHLRERIPYYPPGQVLGPARATGVLNDAGNLCAGVIYHNYDPFVRSMELSCAATSRIWAKREVVSILLRMPFVTAECIRVSAITPRRGTRARRFLEAIGFKREGSHPRAFGNDSAISYGLLREDWERGRFAPPPEPGALGDGEEIRPHAAAGP